VAAEARWLRERGARLVLGDIPPLAFAAAAEAEVPSMALGNFSWDWIYRHLAKRRAGFEEAALAAAAAYARAGLLLRLPFAGDLRAFPRREDVPLVARRPRVGKADARQRLGLEPAKPAVLFSFGGLGMREFGLRAPELREYQLLATGRGAEADPAGRLRILDGTALAAVGLDYPDLVGAADVVVTKPGYGIVTDCIGAATRLVYTDRGDFPEYPIMVAEMKGYLPARYVTNDEIRSGRIGHALEQVLLESWPALPDLSGAARVADRLLGML
jgi:L-arabinokinase